MFLDLAQLTLTLEIFVIMKQRLNTELFQQLLASKNTVINCTGFPRQWYVGRTQWAHEKCTEIQK